MQQQIEQQQAEEEKVKQEQQQQAEEEKKAKQEEQKKQLETDGGAIELEADALLAEGNTETAKTILSAITSDV